MKIVIMLFAFCLSLLSTTAFSQIRANNSPPATYEDYGACPFECCRYQEWTVREDTQILKKMKKGSPEAFKVVKGEEVTGVTGVVITTKAGVARVINPVEINGTRIDKGEIVYLLTYLGEGVYKFSYKNNVIDQGISDMDLELLSRPESIWWMKIKNKKGQTGWTDQTDNFGNVDACS